MFPSPVLPKSTLNYRAKIISGHRRTFDTLISRCKGFDLIVRTLLPKKEGDNGCTKQGTIKKINMSMAYVNLPEWLRL